MIVVLRIDSSRYDLFWWGRAKLETSIPLEVHYMYHISLDNLLQGFFIDIEYVKMP